MIVVSDTSVITNLLQLDLLDILHATFGQIIIPEKVAEELSKISGQLEIVHSTDWIEIRALSKRVDYNKLIESLDPGESEAIAMALELHADALLIDEKEGRRVAQGMGIVVTGLLGILLIAKENSVIHEIKPILDKLIFELGFRINPKLYRKVLDKAEEF